MEISIKHKRSFKFFVVYRQLKYAVEPEGLTWLRIDEKLTFWLRSKLFIAAAAPARTFKKNLFLNWSKICVHHWFDIHINSVLWNRNRLMKFRVTTQDISQMWMKETTTESCREDFCCIIYFTLNMMYLLAIRKKNQEFLNKCLPQLLFQQCCWISVSEY